MTHDPKTLAALTLLPASAAIAAEESSGGVLTNAWKQGPVPFLVALVVALIAGFCCGLAGLTSESARLVIGIFAAILPGTLAIRHIYDAGIAKAFWAWLIASVLTIVLFFAAVFALGTLRT